MELARKFVLEIASTSQRIVTAATEYAYRKKFRNVKLCHLRLEKEMQSISVAAGGVLGVLCKSSLPNGPPLDDRLQEWLSSDELPTCLDTLHEMERMLRDDTWMNMIFEFVANAAFRSSAPEDKIDMAVKLFDSRKSYFHFLLTTDIWNREELQVPRADSKHAQDKQTPGPVLQSGDRNLLTPDQERAITLCGPMNVSPVIEEEDRRRNYRNKLDEILRWLNGLSCAAKQEETLLLRQPDTCTWLESTPEYESWKKSDGRSLWLHGKPGSGKTVLASFAVESLKSGQPLAFFYCDFRSERSTNAAEIMRSLLSQLLRHLREGKIGPGNVVDELIKEKNGDTPILSNVKQLAALVSRAAKQFDSQPFFVVDALDECKDLNKLIDALHVLIKGNLRLFLTSRPVQSIKDGLRDLPSISLDKMYNAVSADIALHVRRELESRRRLRDLEQGLKMEIHSILCDNADGMFRWVQCQIDTLNRCATKVDVREALDHLPIGLDETYKRIVLAIDTELSEGKLALRTLTWLVGSLRPLRLLEILEGLTIDVEERLMHPDAAPLHKGALLDACSSLVMYHEDTDILILSHFSVKEYLIGDHTRLELPRYHIIYLDAHEHLARACICYLTLYLKHIRETGEQTLLHITRTLSHSTLGQRSHLLESATELFSTSQELLDYVFSYGFEHLAHLVSAKRVLRDLVNLQLEIEGDRTAWEVVLRKARSLRLAWPAWEHDFMLYVLTAFASDSLLDTFLGGHRRPLKSKYQTNPLVYAAHFCKPHHGRILLSHGAKVNKKGLVMDTSHCALPLVVAVSRQHEVIVDLLLSAGSIVPPQLFTRCTHRQFPIRIARRLLLTDEFTEWAVELGDDLPSPIGLLERRLSLVYEKDLLVMIRRLVQVGPDLTVLSLARKTAFHSAIEGGYQTIVVYLLLVGVPLPSDFMSTTSRIAHQQRTWIVRFIVDAGLDARVHGTEDTALHLTVMFLSQDECLKAVKTLLGAGHEALVYNKALMTPSKLALKQGYIQVADYLLLRQRPASASLDVLAVVIDGECSLTLILETLRFLISSGANIHGLTHHGDGLLHRAAVNPDERQSLEVTKVLIAAGCKPFACNRIGKTSFDLALDHKSTLLADYLLSTGGPFPSDTLTALLRCKLPGEWKVRQVRVLIDQGFISELSASHNTLLHTTLQSFDDLHGCVVSKLLIAAGCDPFACNQRGETPLHTALDRGHSATAEYLLSIQKPPLGDVLFAVLRSRSPAAWIVDRFCSLIDGSEGFDINSTASDGNGFIHIAVTSLDEDACLTCVTFLVNHGCNPSMRNAQGKTALHLANEMGYILVIRHILSLDQTEQPDQPLLNQFLFSALQISHPQKINWLRMLIEQGADIRATEHDGNTPLHIALSFDHQFRRRDSRRFSVDHQVDVQLDVVSILIDKGCDVSATNSRGETPLHLVVTNLVEAFSSPDNIFVILRLLMWKGANVHSLTAEGDTLLHTVVKRRWLGTWGQLETIKLLVDSGCDPSRCDADGYPPIYFAIGRHLVDIVEYLLPKTSPLPQDLSDAAEVLLLSSLLSPSPPLPPKSVETRDTSSNV